MKSFDQQVADWARTKPAGEAYRYGDVDNCALCQFLRDTGRTSRPAAGGRSWHERGDGRHGKNPISDSLAEALAALPWTFGALADRLSA